MSRVTKRWLLHTSRMSRLQTRPPREIEIFFNEQIIGFSLSHVFHIDFQLEGGLSSPIFLCRFLRTRRQGDILPIWDFFFFSFLLLRSYLHDWNNGIVVKICIRLPHSYTSGPPPPLPHPSSCEEYYDAGYFWYCIPFQGIAERRFARLFRDFT